MKVKKKASPFFHVHAHSEMSILDAISPVSAMVEKVAKMGQPALALTDHGNMAGTVQLYKAGLKHGVKVFPGFEGYLTVEPLDGSKESAKYDRYHLGLIALNLEGYQELCRLTSLTHTRPRFSRFPRMDLSDLAKFASSNIAVTTGCYFGLVQQTLIHQDERAAKRMVQMYARWFPNTFVEIQNHYIDHPVDEKTGAAITDADICKTLVGIAEELGLPVVATQDSHYREQSQKPAHELMKKMVYRGGDGVNEFPGDSFHLASTQWVEEHHEPRHWEMALEGCQKLLDLHTLTIPPLDNYAPDTPTVKKNPQRWLERKCIEGLDELENLGLLKKPRAKYVAQAKHELETIKFLKNAGYFSVIDLIVQFCKDENIAVEARGSANGSLVCYLIGITSTDPLQFGLLFERFMSRDRQKPPDVDLDIEDIRRPDVIAFVDKTFGAQQIGTFQQLGARDGDDKGSMLVTYNSYLRAKLGNDVFIPKFGKGVETIGAVADMDAHDYQGLRELDKNKVKRAYGVHPAGVLLSGDKQKISDYVPTMLVASSDTIVSQFDGKDSEALGYLKADLLGQRTLTTMRRCQELIGEVDDPTDFRWIPMDDKATCRYLSKGYQDNGVFQFEGYAMARGARALKIRSTNDCILAGALFRPACIDSGVTDTYIARRNNRSLKQGLVYPHPAFEEVLKSTNGVVLFQEQVLEIMRRLGLDFEGINTFFDIVKDSGKGATARNSERIKEVEAQWADICARNDIDEVDEAWHFIEGYVKYGFNKAHSAGYGVRSYRVAYFKIHHPLEFHAALLESWAGKDKEPLYIRECRNMEIRLLQADVNLSGALWTIDEKRGAIRKGLRSIKGIGAAAANEIGNNRPYESVKEMIEKNSARSVSGAPKYLKDGEWTGNLAKLKDSGALASLGEGRDSDY